MGKWESRIPIPDADAPLLLLSLRYRASAIPDSQTDDCRPSAGNTYRPLFWR